MSYQKNNTAHPESTRDYKPRLTSTNTWRLVVGVSFIFTAIVLVFFAATPNLSSSVGGSVVAGNNCPDVPPFSNYRGSTFDLKGNLAARGYTYLSHGSLHGGEQVVVSGTTRLAPYIHFNDGGLVYTIKMRTGNINPFGRVYWIEMNARGPVGFGSGCFHLRFHLEDGTYDKYKVCSSTTQIHCKILSGDRYWKTVPVVVKIDWSNYDFHD